MTHKAPRLPIWVDDMLAHLAETQEPPLATGIRFRLWLIAYRRGGRLRADRVHLACISGASLRQFTSVEKYILPGWEYDAETDTYIIRRIVEEIARVEDVSAKAKASIECRWKSSRSERNTPVLRPNEFRNTSPAPAPSPAPAKKKSTTRKPRSACSEPSPSAPLEAAVLKFPTAGKPGSWDLVQSHIDSLSELYPNVDVPQACRSALGWIIANQRKKKTYDGMPAFLNGWMSRDQNSPKIGGNGGPGLFQPRPRKLTNEEINKETMRKVYANIRAEENEIHEGGICGNED